MSIDRRTRQDYRDQAGRYTGTPGCERCGRSRAEFSDQRCNDELHGRGLNLCRKCAAVIASMPTEETMIELGGWECQKCRKVIHRKPRKPVCEACARQDLGRIVASSIMQNMARASRKQGP